MHLRLSIKNPNVGIWPLSFPFHFSQWL